MGSRSTSGENPSPGKRHWPDRSVPHFADKRSFIRAVVEYQSEAILGFQEPLLSRLDSLEALRSWAAAIVDIQRSNGFRGGCALGSPANELVETDDSARECVVTGYRRWHDAIRDGLALLRDPGGLLECADDDMLAPALLTSLQGGLLLAKV